MKTNLLLVTALAGAAGWGLASFSNNSPTSFISSAIAAEAPAPAYQCPMHTWVKSAQAGQCTLCGMEFAAAKQADLVCSLMNRHLIALRPATEKLLGVKTVEVKMQPLVRTLRVAGLIGEDESQHGIISAPADGRIDGLAMNCPGEQIHLRQPVATFFSRPILAAAEDYQRKLKTGGAELEVARQQLEQFGLIAEQINAIPTRQADDFHFSILARLSGTIVKSFVSEGQYVKAGEKLFETADFTKMWFVFAAYEQDLPFIHQGQFVEIRTASLPGETLRAKVAFISPNLDEKTRTAAVRVVLENPDGRIKNNLYAEGMVMTEAETVLAIPRQAVLYPGQQPRVYVQRATGAYEQRTVKLGRVGDNSWEILDGLKTGEKVVLAGNLLMDAQSQLEHPEPTLGMLR